MKNLTGWILAFAAASVVFFLLLIFLRIPFPLYPLISYQDVFDVLTPIVLIPMYWLLFKSAAAEPPGQSQELLLGALAAVWVLGHGMHLAANSIDNLAEALARSHQLDIMDTSLYRLTYFFDERLGHIVWHIGIVGLAVLLVYRARRSSVMSADGMWPVWLGGLLYGFTLFCIFIEGQTVILGLPFVVCILVLCVWGRRTSFMHQPLLAFFFVSGAVALLLFIGWGIYWRGFPQFTDVGLI